MSWFGWPAFVEMRKGAGGEAGSVRTKELTIREKSEMEGNGRENA